MGIQYLLYRFSVAKIKIIGKITKGTAWFVLVFIA